MEYSRKTLEKIVNDQLEADEEDNEGMQEEKE
jgi:hypothetical protein